MQKNEKGFTLIELLVVIAIIGLLSTLAVVALNSARQKSRDSKRVADIKQIQTALELYFADNNGYPAQTTAAELGILAAVGAEATGTRALCSVDGFANACGTNTTYMGLVPAKPTPVDGGTLCTAATNAYMYTAPADGSTYSLTFCIGTQLGELIAGGHTATPNGLQ